MMPRDIRRRDGVEFVEHYQKFSIDLPKDYLLSVQSEHRWGTTLNPSGTILPVMGFHVQYSCFHDAERHQEEEREEGVEFATRATRVSYWPPNEVGSHLEHLWQVCLHFIDGILSVRRDFTMSYHFLCSMWQFYVQYDNFMFNVTILFHCVTFLCSNWTEKCHALNKDLSHINNAWQIFVQFTRLALASLNEMNVKPSSRHFLFQFFFIIHTFYSSTIDIAVY